MRPEPLRYVLIEVFEHSPSCTVGNNHTKNFNLTMSLQGPLNEFLVFLTLDSNFTHGHPFIVGIRRMPVWLLKSVPTSPNSVKSITVSSVLAANIFSNSSRTRSALVVLTICSAKCRDFSTPRIC